MAATECSGRYAWAATGAIPAKLNLALYYIYGKPMKKVSFLFLDGLGTSLIAFDKSF